MFKITITIVIIFVYLRHRLSFGANSDINYSRIRALMDGKTPRCVLNQPIRTYKAQSKFHCLIGCSRNPNCTGVVVWISGALLCKEIGQPPYIFVVAPLLCTFYQVPRAGALGVKARVRAMTTVKVMVRVRVRVKAKIRVRVLESGDYHIT